MTSPPPLFDGPLLRRRIARARRLGYVDFLLARLVEDLGDRLATVRRRFPAALDLATPTPAAASALRAGGQVDRVTRLSPVPESALPSLAVGDPETLPFAPARFDLAVSLLALQHVNDLPGALVQVRRVLKGDGLFVGALLGGQTLTELRQAFAQAESEIEDGLSPRVAPFVEVRDLGGLLQRAGFALPVTDSDRLTIRYPDLFALARDLRGMGFANALRERRRTPLRRATLMRAAEIYARRFSDPDGRIRATFEILWFSGWAPHVDQPKPLRPGSARMRLAEALGTVELTAETADPPARIAIAPNRDRVRVQAGGVTLADSRRALRLTEAGCAPVLYLPRADARMDLLARGARRTRCPYKGDATHYDLTLGGAVRAAVAWSYEDPLPAVAPIAGHLAFYAEQVEAIEEVPA